MSNRSYSVEEKFAVLNALEDYSINELKSIYNVHHSRF